MRLRPAPKFAWALAALCAAACLPVNDPPDLKLAGQQVRLTFLHTSDLHSRLLPFDFAPLRTDVDLGLIPEAAPFGGATRLASLLQRERARADRVLHVDSGDAFQGAPVFNLKLGEAEYRFFSLVGLDAAVIGNHEFDAGPLNFTQKAKDFASFPVLAANYSWDDWRSVDSNQTGLYAQPYALFNMKGVRVGLIGLANIGSLNSIVEGGNSLQVTPLEQNEVTRAYVDMLRPSVDLLMVVSHAGLTEDQDLVQGYEAYYEYGKIQSFLTRGREPWELLEWFGPQDDPKSVVRVRIPGVSGLDVILGGHLHVVLNPPQLLTDPRGRKVILSHGGAFAKYLGRLDVVVQMPPEGGAYEGAEVLSHDYKVFPVDSLWCDEELHQYYKSRFWSAGEFRADPHVVDGMARCKLEEERYTQHLMMPYIQQLDFQYGLTQVFSYAPRDVSRRNNSTGGDSPLGNFAADSMRKRRRVDAEVAVTNSLGIRDSIYAGPITQESMFNVFPFENTINIMYLSGAEMQQLMDFITERSAERGCQSQAQVSGVRFTMDCAQVQLNDLRLGCTTPADCPQEDREGHAPWQCLEDPAGSRCWAHPGTAISINGKPLDAFGTYKIAVNDYIAKGGSGFQVLKRNTTRIETGISLRDSLVGYMQGFCSCEDLLEDKEYAPDGVTPCGNLVNGVRVVDEQALAFCQGAKAFEAHLASKAGECTCREALAGDTAACGRASGEFSDLVAACTGPSAPPGPALARCSCLEALQGNTVQCGHVTPNLRSFCENPTRVSVTVGFDDGRIGRRVK